MKNRTDLDPGELGLELHSSFQKKKNGFWAEFCQILGTRMGATRIIRTDYILNKAAPKNGPQRGPKSGTQIHAKKSRFRWKKKQP